MMRQGLKTSRRHGAGADEERRSSSARRAGAEVFTAPCIATLEFGAVGSMPVGTVVAADASGTIIGPTTEAYDARVVGVVVDVAPVGPLSPAEADPLRSPDRAVALCGLVPVRVCSDGGPIAVGDLLVSARRAGTAMRARDGYRALGAVVGKAMAPYRGGRERDEGVIPMIAMSR